MIDNEKYAVTDNPHLQRDGYSKAILNTDMNALKEHQRKQKMSQELEQNNAKIIKLEQDVSDIKTLLTTILNKL
jgi:hypothetical protein